MKKLSLLILAFAFAFSAQAQLHGYKWRFGVSAGTTNYLGDIRPMEVNNFQNFTKYYKRYKTYSDQLSYQLSIEYALGNSVGLMLTGGSYQFGSSDRFIKNDGSLFIESPTFDRALNFQTDVYDAGLSFVIKPDNNWLLSGKSFFAPYITVGAGVQSFKVHGDLLDANGNQYNYFNAAVIPDGVFETELSSLRTENPDGYKTTSLYANVGLGLRFRITKSIELFAQSDFKRTNTDYLDDVSGVYRSSYDNAFQEYAAKPGTNMVSSDNPYRGMENGRPDWYIYHGIGVKFSLGANKKSFNPPVITQRYTYVPTELSNAQMAKEEAQEKARSASGQVTNNYFTVIQLPTNGSAVSGTEGAITDSTTLAELDLQIDSLTIERQGVQQSIATAGSDLENIDQALALAERDSSVSENIMAVRVTNLQTEKSTVETQMIELMSQHSEFQFKLDSLNAVKNTGSASVSKLDSANLMNQLIIYPGQVSKILYSSNPAVLSLDSTAQVSDVYAETTASNTMTREQFDEEMEQFRSDMLAAQATRDSAMMMAFSSQNQIVESRKHDDPEPQEFNIETSGMDDKTAKKLEKNSRKQDKLEEKNNRLLRDALLVGGTAATTAAISNSGDKKNAAAVAANDSTLRARIAQDSLIIDSLSNIPRVVDTVTVKEIQEKNVKTLLHQSKIEVYFDVNNAELTDAERDKLSPVADYMKENPEVSVELVGFADNTGSVSYNLNLTEKRVEAVSTALKDYFKIPSERINISNGGLIIRGNSKGSVETDRKVEIRVLKN
ncbi:OmpA family protein [Algoriphagus chordae]|uniref:Outer membrane protein OmpA-like peptidoglycan-associated protein n=1 Tax=Algoriphagus chordae TaxID=237019 RepID=A0A2W7RMJ3_9BACT|nr:OmpA family protein [Algoriphagus chordae]PZX51925.1 outer membrane protein OmpA-like peptidoglycan-associated protein [Algoriphagus chordae]